MQISRSVEDTIRYVQDINPDAEFLEGHDNAILGIAFGQGINQVVAYSEAIIVRNLYEEYLNDDTEEWEDEEECGMGISDQAWQQAFDFAGHSIFSVAYGDNYPIFIDDLF
tara:strand:- start:57 stop:389 length:333 start_codon:yes stop_codon:yes gene_type:complete